MSNDLSLSIIPLMFASLSDVDRIVESKSLRDGQPLEPSRLFEEIRTGLVAAFVIEKQVTEHSETVTVVPSEELYSSRSSLLKQK